MPYIYGRPLTLPLQKNHTFRFNNNNKKFYLQKETESERDGSDVTLVALKLAKKFALFLAKTLKLAKGFALFLAKNLHLSFSTMKWR